MNTFDQYSRYYDLLYRDKDYEAETTFLLDAIARHKPGKLAVLDLGCGTGVHAGHLAAAGMSVHGVDISETMLAQAQRRAAESPALAERLSFSKGDVRNVRIGRTFDVVIALFHVVSYQVENDDLLQMFHTAAAHLAPGGLFIFDYWFAPAVLTQRPAVRVKRLEDADIEVTRIAEPVLDECTSQVQVNYQVIIRRKKPNDFVELHETHSMRYLSLPEVDLLGRATGLQVVESFEWLTKDVPSAGTWGVCSVLVKSADIASQQL